MFVTLQSPKDIDKIIFIDHDVDWSGIAQLVERDRKIAGSILTDCCLSFNLADPKTSQVLSQTGCRSHALTAALATWPNMVKFLVKIK